MRECEYINDDVEYSCGYAKRLTDFWGESSSYTKISQSEYEAIKEKYSQETMELD